LTTPQMQPGRFSTATERPALDLTDLLHTLRDYWAQQIGRGKGITQSAYYIEGRSLGRMLIERIGETIVASILRSILVLPIVYVSI
jgi:hypothetical protein